MNDTYEINIFDLIRMVTKRWWITLTLVIVFGITSFVYYSNFVPARYTSSGTLYITIDNNYSSQGGDINLNDIQAAQQLSNTYIAILSSNTFFKTIAVESGLDYDYKEIEKLISYSSSDESEIIGVRATTKVPEHSAIIVNTILNNAQSEVSRVVVGGSVKSINTPEVPLDRSYPNITKSVFLALVLAFILGCGINFMIEFFDDSIKTVDDILAMFEIPVIGEIPVVTNDKYYVEKDAYYLTNE